MITRNAKPTPRKIIRRDLGSAEHDPAQLSAKLRELSMRAFQLVRARDASASDFGGRPKISQAELEDVRTQIIQLQRTLRTHHMDGLAAYVTALRDRVEECLS